MTAHIAGCAEDFVDTVIMPGDPLRAKQANRFGWSVYARSGDRAYW